jgi:hypothetical protein
MNMEQKKIKDMTSEERTEYNRLQKRESRERERQEQLAKRVPNSRDYQMPQVQQRALSEHSGNIRNVINTEVEHLGDAHIVDTVICVLFGFENNFTQKVVEPSGMLVGGYFPDAVAHEAVEHAHRFPDILNSLTFKKLYDELLERVVKWDNQTHHAYSTPEFISTANQELAGTYVLPTPPALEPHKPPAPIEPPASVPSDEKIRERGREQLLRQLDPSIPLEARQYLEGGSWR